MNLKIGGGQMMRQMVQFNWLVLLFMVAGLGTANAAPPKSAVRQRGVSYHEYVTVRPQGPKVPARNQTAMDRLQIYNRAQFPEVTQWENAAVLQSRFERVRDRRWIQDDDHKMRRRSTWLFPDDGCYARAALAVANLMYWRNPVPKKVFAVGDLTVRTPNSPYGEVTWWYHVAPLVEVNGEKFVLDPAIEPGRPLKLREWLVKMSPYPDQLRVAVCGSGTIDPDDICDKESDGKEELAMTEQRYFLYDEWERLVELNRDPQAELGDSPPWLN